MAEEIPLIVVTPGDPDGVGPEICLKVVKKYAAEKNAKVRLLFVGALAVRLMLLVRQQSIVMGFADVFLMLAVLFVGFAALAMLMRQPERIGAFRSGNVADPHCLAVRVH